MTQKILSLMLIFCKRRSEILEKIDYSIIEISMLKQQELHVMYQLASTFYENMAPTVFFRKLGEKDYCVILRDENQEIVGFQMLKLLHIKDRMGEIHGVSSEDMISMVEEWDDLAVVNEMRKFCEDAIRQYGSFYWYLTCKDYRTYNMFKNNFVEYFPNCNGEQSEVLRKAMIRFGRFYYHHEFDEKLGIIRHKYFKWIRNIPKDKRKILKQSNPVAATFMFMNPYFYRGNDLICVAKFNCSGG